MSRRRGRPGPADPAAPAEGTPPATAVARDDGSTPLVLGTVPARPVDIADLPILGISRRRIGTALGVVMAVWIVIVFARQVGEASAATSRAEALATANVELERRVVELEQELDLITRPEYVTQQARGEGFGAGREVPFVLADDAPPLPADAPGSASVRLGAEVARRTPLEVWLDLLFGPGA
jgi:cell division protein FtsB